MTVNNWILTAASVYAKQVRKRGGSAQRAFTRTEFARNSRFKTAKPQTNYGSKVQVFQKPAEIDYTESMPIIPDSVINVSDMDFAFDEPDWVADSEYTEAEFGLTFGDETGIEETSDEPLDKTAEPVKVYSEAGFDSFLALESADEANDEPSVDSTAIISDEVAEPVEVYLELCVGFDPFLALDGADEIGIANGESSSDLLDSTAAVSSAEPVKVYSELCAGFENDPFLALENKTSAANDEPSGDLLDLTAVVSTTEPAEVYPEAEFDPFLTLGEPNKIDTDESVEPTEIRELTPESLLENEISKKCSNALFRLFKPIPDKWSFLSVLRLFALCAVPVMGWFIYARIIIGAPNVPRETTWFFRAQLISELVFVIICALLCAVYLCFI